MICNFVLGLCVVGGMQVGPDKYLLEIMDADQIVHSIVIKHESISFTIDQSSSL